jgi:hypothetical protein
LAEVKHQGELKLQHAEPIACGRILHTTIHWKNRRDTTPMLPQLAVQASAMQAHQAVTNCPAGPPSCQDTTHQPARTPPAHPLSHWHTGRWPPSQSISWWLGRPSAEQTEYVPTGATLGKKKLKEETKFRNPELPIYEKLFNTTLQWENKRAPSPPAAGSNLPRRCRQKGLDAKGITPEVLRLKCCCSWTGNFFFFLAFL